MITLEDVVTIPITEEVVAYLQPFISNTMFCGVSRIRGVRDRKESLSDDQFVGHTSHYLTLCYLLGDEEGRKEYEEQRHQCDANPSFGDGGRDSIRYPLDIKGSMMRASQDPLAYHLLVRPQERTKKHIYVRTLVNQAKTTLYIIGWFLERELPKEPESHGVMRGAYKVSDKELHPIEVLKTKLHANGVEGGDACKK